MQERLDEVSRERDAEVVVSSKLRQKNLLLSRIITQAVNEQQHAESENQ
jgi:hypothetical protein